ncbi:hypothetical protein FVA74_13380 [Salinibacterium sp. dk2585]|uniref:hypothetical protein n=1 Tax=unclassified Salinibacterium TaxID=2632331 RepID=UPI0011C2486C|nr:MULTISPECIES: hypothetical protein [unclassified Salinibacterium]QEE62453.1 hypothetical protein FVA74_13380 [Salinibacterium sp. dk2585]TXK55168.1 hypothetical protein FVP63_00030 [Salinibacterium sp. dk5596]
MTKGAPSPGMLDRLRESLPSHRFSGASSRINHKQIEFLGSLIDSAGIVDKIEEWQDLDRKKRGPGGRPRVASTRTVLILLLVLSTENNALLATRLAVVAAERLGGKSRRYLGITAGRTHRQWYFPLWRALKRTIAAIDPQPGQRRKFPTPEEIEEVIRQREADGAETKQERLDWVCNQLIEATLRLIPTEFQQNWNGDVTTDATVIAAYGKRGAPWGSKRGAIEYDAGWYLRTANHEVPEDHKKAKKAVFGWDVTLAMQANFEPGTSPGHPLMIAGMGMTVPGRDLIETGRCILESIVERDHPIGRAAGDRGYAASAKPEDYQIPLRRLGYKIFTDYRDDQLGKKEGYAGAIQVEGAFYCPSMPKKLVEATIDYRAGVIDPTTWRLRIKERRQYMLRAKEKPDAAGRVPMMCPARGPGATANCPLASGGCGKADDAKTTIYNPPAENKRDSICTNSSSVSFPIEAAAKFIQEVPYGSPEWSKVYATDRNTIEGQNGFLKDGSNEAIGDGTRRRIRGYAGQYLLIAVLVVTGNLRKLQAFRDEMLEGSEDHRRVRQERKLAARERRRNKKDRIAPWDNFAQRQRAERDAVARAADPPAT